MIQGASQVVLVVKNPPASTGDAGDKGLILGQEDPLVKGMETYSSIFAWITPWTEEPGGLQSIMLQRVRHNHSDLAGTFTEMIQSTQEDVCRLYKNTMPFYIRDLSFCGFQYPPGVLEPVPHGYCGMTTLIGSI